jgi:hypothetical protein
LLWKIECEISNSWYPRGLEMSEIVVRYLKKWLPLWVVIVSHPVENEKERIFYATVFLKMLTMVSKT